MKSEYQKSLNSIINKFFSKVIGFFLREPGKAMFFMKVLQYQKHARKRREELVEQDFTAPPIMIFSITNQCNLKCAGCYHKHTADTEKPEMSGERIDRLFNEAWNLGTGIIMIAGGEPFMRMDILRLAENYQEMMFPVFTNGTLINEQIGFLVKNPHILPVLSIEGDKERTDTRRGEGLFEKTLAAATLLKKSNVVFGFSLTMTSENTDEICTADYIKKIMKLGANIVFFVEYVPQSTKEEHLCLTDTQKRKLEYFRTLCSEQYSAHFLSLPGDETLFDGCLAGGRGFIHVNAAGDVEPCPFAPYSTSNLNEVSLKEALSSPFLQKIRDSHNLLNESKGGCTLWENKEWVEKQILAIQPAETGKFPDRDTAVV